MSDGRGLASGVVSGVVSRVVSRGVSSASVFNLPHGMRGREAVAWLSMSFAVLCHSFIPLGVVLAGGAEAPWEFNFRFRLGGVLGVGLFLLVWHFGWLFSSASVRFLAGVWSVPGRRWLFAGLLLSSLDFPFYGWSASYLQPTVAALVFGVWPCLAVLVTARLFRSEGRYRSLNRVVWLALALSGAGMAIVVLGQGGVFSGGEVSAGSVFSILFHSWLGVLLAVSGAGLSCLIVSAWKLGFSYAPGESGGGNTRPVVFRFGDSLARVALLFVVAWLLSSGLSAVLVLVAGGDLLPVVGAVDQRTFSLAAYGPWFLLVAAFLAGSVNAWGNVLWGRANLFSRNLGVNALNYAVPALSAVWLVAAIGFLGGTSVSLDPNLVVLGGTFIVLGNLLSGLGGRLSRQAWGLILGLFFAGAVLSVPADWGAALWPGGGLYSWLGG